MKVRASRSTTAGSARIRIKAFGAVQFAKVGGLTEVRIFSTVQEGLLLNVYPKGREPGDMPFSGGCWWAERWTTAKGVEMIKCVVNKSGCPSGCVLWELYLDKPTGRYKWRKTDQTEVEVSKSKGFICGCSDQP